MKLTNFWVIVAFMTIFTISSSAMACVGGFLKLSPADALGANGIYGSTGLVVTVDDMKNERIATGRARYNINDNKTNTVTHTVEYLGSISDVGGIIQSSYLVLDTKTKIEKVVMLNSNYQGNGVTARDLPSQDEVKAASQLKKQSGFSTLYSVGCN